MPYKASDVLSREVYLRVLLVGAPKSGKTTSAVLTSPTPIFVFNSDGAGALDPVALRGGEFEAEDINSMQDFDKALLYVKNTAAIKTVVLDNISTLGAKLKRHAVEVDNLKDGRQLYPELANRFLYVVNQLANLKKHVIFIGHVDSSDNATAGGFGHILSLDGKAKTLIPGMFQDWIWLEVSVNPETKKIERKFLLAPSGNWTKGVRSVRDVDSMEPDITKFLELIMAGRKVAAKPVATIGPSNNRVVMPAKALVTQTIKRA